MAKDYNLKAVISAVDRISPVLRSISGAAKITRSSLGSIASAGRDLQQVLMGAVAPIAGVLGLGGAGAAGGLIGGVINVSAEFERFQTVLESIEGSAEKARKGMAWVADFATRTPYELADVTGAYVKLKSYGIDPVSGSLEAAGNVAAAMGKPLEQAVEALADAMTGENERLKEFGIVAKKVGDNIVYTWSENGRTIAAKAKANNRAAIQATIQGIWNGRYGGAMEKLSRTWDGLWSNLKDVAANALRAVGGAGLFDYLKGELRGALALFNDAEKSGEIQRVAASISGAIVGALKDLKAWAGEVNWGDVYRDLKMVAGGIGEVVSMLGGIKGIAVIAGIALSASILSPLVSIAGALVRLLPLLGSFFAWLVPLNWGAVFTGIAASVLKAGAAVRALGVAFLATPWGAVIAAIAFVAFEIYKNWDGIVAYVGQAWERIKSVFEVGWFSGMFQLWLEGWQGFGNAIVGIIKDLTPDFLLPDSLRNFQFEFATRNAEAVQRAASALPSEQASPDGFRVSRPDDFQAAQPRVSLPAQMAASQAAVQARAQAVQGDLQVRFINAPPGMRVEQSRVRGPLSLSTDVGYSTLMSGGAY